MLIVFVSVSIFLSSSPLAGWYWLAKFLEVSFVAWYVARNEINKTITGVLLSIGIIFECLLSVAQIIAQGSVGGLLYFLGERMFSASTPGIANASISGELILRPYGTFSHPNMLAGYFLVAMLLSVYLYSSSERRESRSLIRHPELVSGSSSRQARTIIILSSLLFGTIGLVLSLSRVAIAAWLVIGFLTVVITYREKIAKTILLLCLCVGTLLLLLGILFHPFIPRLLSVSFGESFSERVSLAQSATAMIFVHPFFGVGPNNFISSLPFFSKNSFVLQPVHNIYLLVAAELGIPGLLLFCGFLWVQTKKLYISWKKNSTAQRSTLLPLGFALFAILFSGFFDHYFLSLQQGQLLFALVVGFFYKKV